MCFVVDGVPYVPGTISPCSEPVDDLKIYSPSSETVIGENVTLECALITKCLPINYTLFFEKNKVKGRTTKKKAEGKAVFKLTVSSRNELGEYKCKAQYTFNDTTKLKYSRGFSFTLKGKCIFLVGKIQVLVL